MFSEDLSKASRDVKYYFVTWPLKTSELKDYESYMSRISSWYVNILPSLLAIGTVVVEI